MKEKPEAKIFFSGAKAKYCPNPTCQKASPRIQRKGWFITKWNAQPVRRYRCTRCHRTFCSHTHRPHYRQHRPDLNNRVFQLYASGMTQRRMAIVLGVNRKTIVRKFLFLSRLCQTHHEQSITCGLLKTTHAQFDEMESFEHTKLKPVTIAVAVRAKTGELIALKAAPLCYKGPLAALAFRKYGPRPNQAPVAIRDCLKTIRRCAPAELLLTTDCHPTYPRHIRAILPNALHRPTKRRMPELKTDRRNLLDALFTLNYTAAKIRNDLSRMARKTWVTTKKIDRLQAHLNLYLAWNNGYALAH